MIRSEKETDKIIGDMLKVHSPYRKIMKNVQVSPNRIKQIKNKLAGKKSESPKFVKAYRLFSKGKTRLEVAEELEIREEEVRQYSIDYLKLIEGDGPSRLVRMHGPDFLARVEKMIQSLDRNGIRPEEYGQICLKIGSVKSLASEKKVLLESKLNLEQDNKKLLVQNAELIFERAEIRATNGCLQAGGEDQSLKNEILNAKRVQIESEIRKLLETRSLQKAAIFRGSQKLSEECFRQRAQDLIKDFLPCIKEAIRKCVESNGGLITAEVLLYNEEEIEQILLNELNEPLEHCLEWIGEILTEDLYEQNMYG